MRLTGDWLDHPGTQALCAALETAGHQALMVGGCVRNAILGRPVSDLDLASDARPETVTQIAEAAGFRVVPTGFDHGTVTVIAHHRPHEVTTFRRDVETFGRHATVAYSTDMAEDAARRDFTMNALYADRHGTVIDPLGGLPDLLAGQVRFVGDAHQRIAEDYLRILRFFRFHAHFGTNGIDAEGLAACAAHSAMLETISRERIGAEMRKLLSAPDPAPSLAAMAQSGVLAAILPGADASAMAVLVHLEADLPPDPLRRLAALGGQDVAERLRLSRKDAATTDALRAALSSGESPAVLGWRLGADRARDAVLLRAALSGQPLPPVQDEIARGAASVFPVKPADLALEGPALGTALRQVQADWLASDLHATRAALLGKE
jgi:poly(A) polymerase